MHSNLFNITKESLAIETTCVAYNKSSGQNSSLTTSFFFCSLLTQSFTQSFGKREENVCFLRQFYQTSGPKKVMNTEHTCNGNGAGWLACDHEGFLAWKSWEALVLDTTLTSTYTHLSLAIKQTSKEMEAKTHQKSSMSAKGHRCKIREKWPKLPVRANMLHTHDSSSSRQPTWLHSRNCGYICCCKHPAKQLWKQVHSVSGIKVKVLHNQSPVHTLATLSLYTLSTPSYRLLLLFVPFKNLLQNCQHKGNIQHLQRR